MLRWALWRKKPVFIQNASSISRAELGEREKDMLKKQYLKDQKRLIVFFATPYLEMIDKQSRILFHGEFKVLGYDKNTKVANIKPRFL